MTTGKPSRLARVLDRVAGRIEGAEALDGPAAAANSVLRKAIRPGPVEDTLSGTPLGHPLHPLLVSVPIGAWVSALVCDVTGQPDAARRLTGVGLLAAVPTAASGAADWLSTDGAERRTGAVHAGLNYVAIATYLASWQARRRGHGRAGTGLSVLGAAALGAAGWLGGHLVYAQGVGVDTTAFQQLPADWTDLIAADDAPAVAEMTVAEVDGVPVLIAGTADGLRVIADRCTHRGAPLHEGEYADGCITCPWHDSVFAVADGAVVSGPATRPQALLETRVADGVVQVRRVEERSLRTNPTGR